MGFRASSPIGAPLDTREARAYPLTADPSGSSQPARHGSSHGDRSCRPDVPCEPLRGLQYLPMQGSSTLKTSRCGSAGSKRLELFGEWSLTCACWSAFSPTSCQGSEGLARLLKRFSLFVAPSRTIRSIRTVGMSVWLLTSRPISVCGTRRLRLVDLDPAPLLLDSVRNRRTPVWRQNLKMSKPSSPSCAWPMGPGANREKKTISSFVPSPNPSSASSPRSVRTK